MSTGPPTGVCVPAGFGATHFGGVPFVKSGALKLIVCVPGSKLAETVLPPTVMLETVLNPMPETVTRVPADAVDGLTPRKEGAV
jgi:hypothetical protein